MPYIKQTDRAALAHGKLPDTTGELNYTITQIVRAYIQLKGLRYEHINAAVGALECVKLELYRRLAAPYEDTKIKENGDAYNG